MLNSSEGFADFQTCLTPRPGAAESWKWMQRLQGFASEQVIAQPGETSTTVRPEKLARLEAVLLIANSAISTRKLAQFATLLNPNEAKELIDQLNEMYDRGGSAFRIERAGGGYQLMTRAEFSPWLDKIHSRGEGLKLTPPAMETLTIVAYRQPITRADIEAIRGVQCAEMLKQLMSRGLVRINGTEDSLGRPFLYETTRSFLETFGLKSLADLPQAGELRKLPRVSTSVEEDDSETASQVESEES